MFFSFKNGVDEIFESGLNSNRCASVSSCFVAALVKRLIANRFAIGNWRQLFLCVTTVGGRKAAYLSHWGNAGVTNDWSVQVSKRLAEGKIDWAIKVLGSEQGPISRVANRQRLRALKQAKEHFCARDTLGVTYECA